MAAFMPLVPQASSPRRGLLSHRSTPCTSSRRHLHVVVFHEDHVLPQVRIARKLHDLADEALARLVLGMRLAGDDDLHRHVLVQQDALQPLHVAEQQRGALVGGEAARETDGERVGVEHFAGAPHFRGRSLPPQRRDLLPLAHETHQPPLAPAVHFQQLLVRNVFHLLPDGRVVEALAPVRLQVLIVERRPGRR